MCQAKRSISCAVLCLVLSLASLVLGFCLVLALMWHIVIPALDAKTGHRTQCIVHRIYADSAEVRSGGSSAVAPRGSVYMDTRGHKAEISPAAAEGLDPQLPMASRGVNVTGSGLSENTSGHLDTLGDGGYGLQRPCVHVLVLFRIPGKSNKVGRLYQARDYASGALERKVIMEVYS